MSQPGSLSFTIRAMPFDPKRLRKIFAGGAVLVFVIALGFYLHGFFKPQEMIPDTPKNIPSGVEKSATGFNLSKSEGGKTLFTIHAASVQQYKEGGRAALHDVSITVFGRNQDRSDQIYGADFAYDPAAKSCNGRRRGTHRSGSHFRRGNSRTAGRQQKPKT